MYFESLIQCPHCGQEFRVCIESPFRPRQGDMFQAPCPSHGGEVPFLAVGPLPANRQPAWPVAREWVEVDSITQGTMKAVVCSPSSASRGELAKPRLMKWFALGGACFG